MPRSLEFLEQYKAVELRKMAASMMRENPTLIFNVHGIEQTAGWVRTNGKKDALMHHISLWEGQLNQVVEPAIEPVVEEEPMVEVQEPTKKTSKRTAKAKAKVPTVEPVVEETPVVQVQEPTKKTSKRIAKAKAKAPIVEPVVEPSVVEPPVEQVLEPPVEPVVEPSVEPVVELPVISPPIEQAAKPVTDTPYQDSEAEKLAIAKKLYFSTEKNDELTGLREYQLNLCRSGKYFLPEFGILVARARVIIESYADSNSFEGKAHPGTVQKIRVDVMKYLKQLVTPEVDKFLPVNDRTLLDTYNDFENAVRGAFKDIGAIKYKMNQERSHKAEEDVRAIIVLPYLEWAMEQVSHISANSARWKEVAIAIMLLTGRRQSEVLATGLFTYVDESTVVFEGQLKRHIAELVDPEKIPVLGKVAKQVVDAIAWLEEHNKRTLPTERSVEALQLAAKLSHNRCSRYIAEAMDKLADKCEITNGKDWEVKEGNKKVNKFKGHLNRQIYAQICSALFNDSNERKKRAFISRILLENRDAALSYDRDVEVVDIAEVKELCGTFSE
ncbi:MAG: telomere resolvase [Brasilonema angustatum HA4187-MV1]|jgi:hypothetical protein|nr:telomere resolvase [Brasilonema angustatum HA4187-MV1]